MSHSRFGTFATNLMAYCLSEAAAKASRLLVVVAVARILDASAIGIAAVALATSDILKSLTENGVGQRIVAAPAAEFEATCATARKIFRVWCLGLFALQLVVGGVIGLVQHDPLPFLLIAVLAGEYLFMPAGLVQCALAMRQGKMRQTATIAAGQTVGANTMTALLVLVLPGPMALVLPRLLAAPIWTIAMRRLAPWRPAPGVQGAPLRPFFSYGWAVLGVELVKALRFQADKLIVGMLLGTEALGIYFMAFNAGLGLANSFSQAFSIVLFPHLCTAADHRVALRQALALSLGLITPAVVLQALLAPVYVPLLLGPGWADISGIVSVLCLAAVPGIVWTAAAQWLRANDQPRRELSVTVALTAALIANTMLMAPLGLSAIAWGYLVVATVVQVAAALAALAPTFANAPARKV
ncbi:oligosaccharide flippase family protein [Seohaeicola zhoushanensis]|uniref:Polysaccharide biosynthesis protein n=1 Tax=Seohaeicola zhoushanensis TaxID=1569283 RepID=A0A8J3H094_9RHOB|nr:oligosaccharide flippase family protein [Seohaeicola zhoushanensis]GHF59131.1 hypothetical protein GCM10017056_33290 [Seohaeicola zhoushanensis]